MKSTPADPPLRTLRSRLLVFLLAPMAIVLLASVSTDYRFAYDPANEAYDHALLDDAVALAGRVRVAQGKAEVDLPAAAEAVLRSDRTDQEFLAIYGPGGQLLAGDADLMPEPTPNRQNPSVTDANLRGHKIRKATYRLTTGAGEITITVAETTRKRERAGSKILAAMILPNIVIILVTLAIVYVGIRRGLAPLDHLSEEIGRRSPHDLSPLPRTEIPGEAQPLVNAMGTLINDLRAAAGAQQAFLANAAHQLKTPLAGLQTQLELAAQELPDQYRNRVVNLRDATRRLGHLAHQLLALARSGPDADVGHEREKLDLAHVLQSIASSWFDLALTHQIDLGFDPEPAPLVGSEWLLRELAGNLIDNALQYTPAGGHVTVRSGRDAAGRPFLEVEDDGPGIAPEERERIFQRFYRAEGTPGPGTGLGLAIVKEVADRHHASLTLDDASAASGTRIRVTFPGIA